MKKDGNALMEWLGNNPEAANMGIGLLKSLEADRRNQGAAGAEVARTRYGYLTGAGTGDMSRAIGPTTADLMMQGYVAGSQQRQKAEFDNAIKDLLQSKAVKARSGAVKDINDSYDGGMSKEKAQVFTSMPIQQQIYNAKAMANRNEEKPMMSKGDPAKTPEQEQEEENFITKIVRKYRELNTPKYGGQ